MVSCHRQPRVMDTNQGPSVWAVVQDANKVVRSRAHTPVLEDEEDSTISSSTTCCDDHLLNSPFESFAPSNRRGAPSNRRQLSTSRGENDGGDTSPPVVYHQQHHHHHHRETGRMPTTASHPKSTTAFRQLSDLLWQAQLNSVARRNERERKRVKLVNNGFAALRQKIPTSNKLKAEFSSKSSKASKLSKVETLRSAIKYINHLQYLLKECTPNNDSTEEQTRPTSSEIYSDSESVNYHTDCSVFSNNTDVRSANTQEDITDATKQQPEMFSTCNDKNFSFEPIHYNPICANSSYTLTNTPTNYHSYSPVAQNEYFSAW